MKEKDTVTFILQVNGWQVEKVSTYFSLEVLQKGLFWLPRSLALRKCGTFDGYHYNIDGHPIGVNHTVYAVGPDLGRGKIFKATRVLNGLQIGKRSIAIKEAIKRLQNGKDVYSTSRSMAKSLMKKASDAGKVIMDEANQPGYLKHFHDRLRKLKSHSFFD